MKRKLDRAPSAKMIPRLVRIATLPSESRRAMRQICGGACAAAWAGGSDHPRRPRTAIMARVLIALRGDLRSVEHPTRSTMHPHHHTSVASVVALPPALKSLARGKHVRKKLVIWRYPRPINTGEFRGTR